MEKGDRQKIARIKPNYFEKRWLMLALQPRFKSFEEYLAYEDDTDQLYELFNGELIAVPTESGLNFEIATFLLLKFAEIVGYRRVRGNGLELEVHGEPKNRFSYLTIIREEHIAQLAKRNTICLSMLPPLVPRSVCHLGRVISRASSTQASSQRFCFPSTVDRTENYEKVMTTGLSLLGPP